jgi:hypothetical protein
MRDWWRVVLSAVLLVVSSADCTADCDNPHANRESAGIVVCGSVDGKKPNRTCAKLVSILVTICCVYTSACTDDELDALMF